jgi:phage N-6-adenine-methyltransferase
MSLIGFKAQNHRQQVSKRGALDKVDDRRTPRELFDPLNEEFRFTLDVAASETNALTELYYDLHSDGLTSPWHSGHVIWCNPPYSNLGPWAEKAHLEMQRDDGPSVVVMLLPANRTEQSWWQDFIEPGRREGRIEARFLRGRLRFDTPEGTYNDPRGNRPPFGCVLVIWRAG